MSVVFVLPYSMQAHEFYCAFSHLHANIVSVIGKGFLGGLNRVVGWTPTAVSCMHPLLLLLFLPDSECSLIAAASKKAWKNLSRTKLVVASYQCIEDICTLPCGITWEKLWRWID